MSLLRRLQLFYRNRLLGGAGRAAAAALLLVTSLAAPGAPPILAAPAAAGPLAPQTCGVNSTLVANNFDNGDNSLRGAVACATAGQTVTFDSIVQNSTIVLTGTEIAVTQPIAIDGSGAPGVIVDAGNNSRVFNISASGPVTLTALTLQHGSSNVGGAVYDSSSSPLALNGVNVLSSTVTAGTGGGLYANGPLALTNSYFISDTSNSNGGGVGAGGAAVVTGGRFERDTCTTGGCEGGALFGFHSLTVSGTQFISNTSLSHGGAAFTEGAALLTNGSFQGNKCTGGGCHGGGLYANTTLTATNTDFTNNISTSHGGGAFAQGATMVTNGSFQGNKCTNSICFGGGLFAGGTVTLTGTDFIGNISTRFGGGALAQGAALLTNGSFQGNKCTDGGCIGGGLLANTTLTVNGTDFISNTSTSDGGGANVQGTALLTNGSFQGNKCTDSGCIGGGLLANTTLTVNSTDFISNTSTSDGGGVEAFGSALLTNDRFDRNACTNSGCLGGGLLANTTLTVNGTDFTNNQSRGNGGGVGLTATAQITMVNVTLSGNMASVSGGGLYAGGTSTASLYNVTVADNQAPSGGGVRAESGATLGITNTLISNNTADNCSGAIGAGTRNLEFPGNTCTEAGPTAGFTSADPLLAPLALNPPGTTLTQALLPGSPARDAGDPASCANTLVNNLDQRGAIRPDAGGEACDIGAYEAGAPDWLVMLPLVRK